MNDPIRTEDVMLELGRAVYVFQAIEARIKVLLPHLRPVDRDHLPADEGWNGRRKYLDSKEMLGKLIALLQTRLSSEEPELVEQHWREVLQGRNDVIHNFALQPFAGCNTVEDVEQAINYIAERRARAMPLLQLLDTLLHGFVASLKLPPGFEGEVEFSAPEW